MIELGFVIKFYPETPVIRFGIRFITSLVIINYQYIIVIIFYFYLN